MGKTEASKSRGLIFRLLFGLFMVVSAVYLFHEAWTEERTTVGYDERMWTSASVATWSMAKGHVRNTKSLDNWFPSYAWRHKLEIFTGETWKNFNPDTLQFPYDMVTLDEENSGYSFAVKYDTLKFPRERYQWFDMDLWTFGWKAPNLGKYLMGAWIGLRHPDINPQGYFEYVDENGNSSSAPFAYPPDEMIRTARTVNVLFTLGMLAAVFLIGWKLDQFWTGLIAAFYLILNPAFVQVNTAVGLDSFVGFFMLISWILLWKQLRMVLDQADWKKLILAALFSGLAMGAAVSSKLNGGLAFVIAASGFGYIVFRFLKEKRGQADWRKMMISGGISLFSGLLLFWMLNPQVRNQPVASVKTVQQSVDEYFEKRAGILTIAQFSDLMQPLVRETGEALKREQISSGQFREIMEPLYSLSQELQEQITAEKFYDNAPRYWKRLTDIRKVADKHGVQSLPEQRPFYNWVELKNEFLPAFKFTVFRTLITPANGGNYYGTLGLLPGQIKNLFSEPESKSPMQPVIPNNPADLLLVLCGLWVIWQRLKKGNLTQSLDVVLFIMVCFWIIIGNVDFLWNDWARYFTPFLPCFGLLAGMGLMKLIRLPAKKR